VLGAVADPGGALGGPGDEHDRDRPVEDQVGAVGVDRPGGGRISKRGSGAARGTLTEAAWTAVQQPGPLYAFYQRTKARRGHGKAIVATARKLAVLFWCMLTRSEDYAHQQPSLTRKKLRRLEITAGAPKYTRRAARIWSTNELMREAELELVRQAETSYRRMVQDELAGAPSRKAGASVTLERA
jgi:transposase